TSKRPRAQRKGSSLDYERSRTIAEDMMEKSGRFPNERIRCSDLANGERIETYAIAGDRGSGAIELNGAVAHLGKIGDRLTIMAFTEVDSAKATRWKPRVIVLGKKNKIINARGI